MTTETAGWPDHLQQAAAAHGLGPLVSWQKSDLKQGAALAWVLPFVTAAFLLVLGIVVPLVVGYEPGHISWAGSIPIFASALLLAAFGGYMLTRADRAPVRWIGVHQNGLISQVGTQDPVALSWPEIDYVSRAATAVDINGLTSLTAYTTIVRGAGRTVSLNNAFGAVVELSEEIAARSGKEMRRRLSDALESGGQAEFGLLRLTREGVTSQNGFLPWSRVGDVRVRQDQVRITESGQRQPWAASPASGFPNLDVFLALCRRFRAASRGEVQP